MKTPIFLLIALLPLFATAPSGQCEPERYDIDPVHSSVTFKVKHLFSYVSGRFNEVQGTIIGNPEKPEETSVQVEIKTASVDTHEEKRDNHLRSDAFLAAAKYPTITFTSKKVHLTGQDTAFVTGDLTMHGVTREAILDLKFLGKGKGQEGRLHTGWEGRTALKRSDYGLNWSQAVEGTQLVGDDIVINLEIDAVAPKDPAPTPAPAAEKPASAAPAPSDPKALPPIPTPPDSSPADHSAAGAPKPASP